MAEDTFDIVALGDAIVDVLVRRDEAFLNATGATKGTMQLLTAEQADALAKAMAETGEVEEIPGGSAANTLAGAAAEGARCRFIGQIGDDRLGRKFADQMHALSIRFDTPAISVPTGRCMIVVTPDGERTMRTAPGASHCLTADALDEDAIRAASVLFLEGYLWGPEGPRAAMRRAIEIAHGAGRKIAFTLSDSITLPGRRESLVSLVADGGIDILFSNILEACMLAGTDDPVAAVEQLAPQVETLIMTRGPHGAIGYSGGQRVEVPAAHVEKVVDTTGAGDQFAAGFIAAYVRSADLRECLEAGTRTAAAVIGHVGARPLVEIGDGA
ncbi:adenosine kinase [Croceicoccus naphthovorans]|uniref:Carbohydrate kinase PfkB domain-containing protein n=1 Tax=Croceicoccus naphthovorans TaxID=1348774 RepID=A0A0G3XHI6_9SPHN|nr:adenosine kinase [Croceicoccus naphthovorans]AKM10657.1 hypothetical protein AB433_12875 [Croceicoccus naphthovorans]MBB3988890.1 sugar/nucleoside kinase (ribokinase family) [Croceicoccus naphthovorans]